MRRCEILRDPLWCVTCVITMCHNFVCDDSNILLHTAPHCTHVLATPQMTRQDTWHQETNFQEVKSIKIIMKIWPLIDSKILQFSKLQPLNMGKSQAESGLQRSSLHNAGLIRFCCGLGERATEPTPALSNDQNLRNASDEGSMSRGSSWHPEPWI